MTKKYFGVDFTLSKYDGLDGKTKVALQENSGAPDAFTVVVDLSGMNFKGVLKDPISSEKQLQDFALMVSSMWSEHRKLAPKILTNIKDH